MSSQVFWFVCCFLLVGCQIFEKPLFQAVSHKVVDGDTCIIEKEGQHIVIRLVGVDAWEISYNQRLIRQVLFWKRRGYAVSYEDASRWGTNAWRFLSNLIPEGSLVLVKTFGRDSYGRILASLYISNQWVNEKMIESGWAMVYRIEEIKGKEKQRLLEAEKKAKRSKKGMWNTFLYEVN